MTSFSIGVRGVSEDGLQDQQNEWKQKEGVPETKEKIKPAYGKDVPAVVRKHQRGRDGTAATSAIDALGALEENS